MLTHLYPDILIGLRLVIRARFFSLGFWLVLALAAVVMLAAQFSGRQPATVALDVGISVIRLTLPIVIVLLVQELFTREFDRRYFLSSLTYPRSRHLFLLGRFTAAYILLLALLVVMALVLMVLVSFVTLDYVQATPVALDHHYILTIAFIAIDLLVILAMATLLAITATTPSFVLIGTLSFMIVARSFSTIVLLLTHQQDLVSNPEVYRQSLGLLSYILPDLGALDIRGTALYGLMIFLPSDWSIRIISILSYTVALVGFSLWALQRKRFS